MLKKKMWASFQRIIELFTQKFVTNLSATLIKYLGNFWNKNWQGETTKKIMLPRKRNTRRMETYVSRKLMGNDRKSDCWDGFLLVERGMTAKRWIVRFRRKVSGSLD